MRLLLLASALALAFVGSAFAQSTGGRVGGFGGSSSSPSSRYRSPTSSSSSSSSSSSTSPSRPLPTYEEQQAAAEHRRLWRETHEERGAPTVTPEELRAFEREAYWSSRSLEDGALIAGGTFFFALVLYGIGWLIFAKRDEVRRLSLGFGPRARVELQERLRTLARHAKTATPQQRAALLAEVLSLLRAHRDDVRYVAWQAIPTRHEAGVKRFFALASELRGRYRHETTATGARAAPDLTYRAEEGPGLLVVSVLTFASRGKHAFGKTPRELDLALFAMEHGFPAGLELIWSPSEQADRLSSAELQTLYPELQRLDDTVGRVVCRACSAVHPRELGRCPACGQPS